MTETQYKNSMYCNNASSEVAGNNKLTTQKVNHHDSQHSSAHNFKSYLVHKQGILLDFHLPVIMKIMWLYAICYVYDWIERDIQKFKSQIMSLLL